MCQLIRNWTLGYEQHFASPSSDQWRSQDFSTAGGGCIGRFFFVENSFWGTLNVIIRGRLCVVAFKDQPTFFKLSNQRGAGNGPLVPLSTPVPFLDRMQTHEIVCKLILLSRGGSRIFK